MTMKVKSARAARLAMGAFAIIFAFGPAPAAAQNDRDSAQVYGSGVDLGRTLNDPRQCTGSGEYAQGCVDGVDENLMERQANQLLDSEVNESKPPEKAPLLSPPPDLFHDPFSKPGDGTPQN